jgi:hypothetical protein
MPWWTGRIGTLTYAVFVGPFVHFLLPRLTLSRAVK